MLVGKLWKGVYAVDADGRPLTLAIVDDAGHVIEQGETVSREAWKAVLKSYLSHLRELGLMRTLTEPPELLHSSGNDENASSSSP